MNLRHTAALALVGWYLMMPPVYKSSAPESEHISVKLGNDYFSIHDEAPISEWENSYSYDPASDCQAVILRLLKQKVPKAVDSFEGQQSMRNLSAKCISSDDPRLKENR
jgi:hypothetical protein